MSSRPAGLLTRGDAVGLALLLLAALAFAPLQSYSLVLALVMVYAITAGGLVLLFGVAGQLSLGHAIFLGVGAFVSANVSDRTGFGLEVELPLSFVITFVLGLVVGLPAIRVRELYLALATFALAYAGQKGLFEFRWFSGGGAGRRSGPLELFGVELTSRLALVWVSFATMLVSFWLLRNLIRARTGRAMHAVRTSETAAAAVGIDVGRFKVLAFGFSAGFAGMAGVLYIHTIRFVNPENFGVDLSILLILTLIIGGKHRLAGAVAGAIFVQGVPEAFRSIQDWEGMIYGATLLALTLWSPGGLIGIVELAIAPIRRAWLGEGAPSTPAEPVDVDVAAVGAPATAPPPRPPTATPTGRLVLSDICVHFGGVTAVDGVSLVVEPGTVVGLIGSNGAGKTTLFNAATGIVPATGTVEVDGVDLSGLSARRRADAGLGRTFQNLNLHEGMTTIEHVLIGLHQRARYGTMSELFRLPHVTRTERELWDVGRDLLDRLGLTDVATERVDDLPYGLQKRVDVARALATGPKILLLDEPAAGLPGVEASETIARVLDVARDRGAATLIIEHNVELVAAVCDHIVVMDAGRVLRTGRPDEVMRDQSVIDAYLGSERVSSDGDLVINGLQVGYGRNLVVHGVGLRVPAGTRVSLLGANGAGKTTILRTISGLVRPRSGTITFGGRDLTAMSAAELVRHGVVQVPEGRRVFPALSVEENLRLAAYKRPEAVKTEGRNLAYALFPALAELRDRAAGLLSGGQQQMLALGRAVVARPRLLMLDEMSLGLAPILVKDFYARLGELFGDDLTLLMVEQNARLALNHSSYFYVLRNGEVTLEGETAAAPDMTVIQAAYLGTGAGRP